ncbi:YbjN domain-containing protein [Allorhizobium sp. BGMRC 0089]|uniref:YbjN domain-containing protein n=1 Tax=Allorhizobium sonneratiae TaxID=2934936 RepID=UPI0020340DE1|nr:YbjN domain-containing protein [Allorhizobium sonneratiae]MCM2291236.1 YbjN domain-containing protein [Allorhizobium sonneratiae]
MNLLDLQIERQSNPVDMIEFVASNNDWSFERSCEDEIAMTVEGRWAAYHVSFSWMEEREALHMACAFDLRVPDNRLNEVVKLLSLINGQVLMGHFDLWRQEDVAIFRQSLLLSGGAEPNNQQVEVLLANAVEACEAYFEAFQYVIWSGLDARSAIDAVLFETVGEA